MNAFSSWPLKYWVARFTIPPVANGCARIFKITFWFGLITFFTNFRTARHQSFMRCSNTLNNLLNKCISGVLKLVKSCFLAKLAAMCLLLPLGAFKEFRLGFHAQSSASRISSAKKIYSLNDIVPARPYRNRFPHHIGFAASLAKLLDFSLDLPVRILLR